MGARGPVPKRSTERRRRNKDSEPETVAVDGGPVRIPDPEDSWHPIARDWYISLKDSGQATYFEPSDWQAARFVAEVISKNLRARKFSSVLFAAVWSAMNDLLTTEASRRRVRMEIDRQGGEQPMPLGVTAIADYKKQMSA